MSIIGEMNVIIGETNLSKWIAALRSGWYTQGTRRLQIDGKYCCLGVLTDLYSLETGEKWDEDGTFDGNVGMLPGKVRQWLGVGIYSKKLMDMNDEQRCSFVEISNWIEENYASNKQ